MKSDLSNVWRCAPIFSLRNGWKRVAVALDFGDGKGRIFFWGDRDEYCDFDGKHRPDDKFPSYFLQGNLHFGYDLMFRDYKPVQQFEKGEMVYASTWCKGSFVLARFSHYVKGSRSSIPCACYNKNGELHTYICCIPFERRYITEISNKLKSINSDLSGVKPGDWVCTPFNGWVRVSNSERGVVITEDEYSFNLEGKYDKEDEYPTCFTKEQLPIGYKIIFGDDPSKFMYISR